MQSFKKMNWNVNRSPENILMPSNRYPDAWKDKIYGVIGGKCGGYSIE